MAVLGTGLTLLVGLLIFVGGACAEPPDDKSSPRTDLYGDPLPEGAIARMGTLRFRFEEPVTEIVFAPDGKTIAATIRDGTVRLCETATGKELQSFKESKTEFSNPAFSGDGKLLGMLGAKSRLYLWDTATGKLRNRIGSSESEISCFSCAPDGKTMATVESDSVIRLRDVATGGILRSLRGHKGAIGGVAFSPDSKRLASACWGDDSVRLWDIATGKILHTNDTTLFDPVRVGLFAFSPDGRLLALSSSDRKFVVWDTTTGKEFRRLKGMDPHQVSRPFLLDSKTLVVLDDKDRILWWDVVTGKEFRQVKTFQESVICLAISPDGKILASADHHGVICLWDAATGQRADRQSAHRNWVRTVAFSPDGKTLASTDGDGAILLWESLTGRLLRRLPTGLPDIYHIEFTPDGNSLVLGGFRNALYLWDIQRNKLIRKFKGHDIAGWTFALAPDGKTLACGTQHGQVVFWDISTGREQPPVGPHGEWIIALAFSGDGKRIVTVEKDDDSIRLWDRASGKELGQFKEHSCNKIALSPNGNVLAMGGGQQPVWLYDTATGKMLYEFGLEGLENLGLEELGIVWEISISPDGRMVAAADTGGQLVIWELATGRPRIMFKSQREATVYSHVWSSDSRLIATGSTDTTAIVWDVTAQPGRREPKSEKLAAKELSALWNELADGNASRAYRAMGALIRHQSQAVTLIKERLPPMRSPEPKRVAELLVDFDSEEFAVRRKATQELEKFGDVIEPALRKALAGNPSAEKERRVQQLLDKLCGATSPERLRLLRAIEVLERVDTGEALAVLKSLAGSAPEARLTQEAKAALDRLEKQQAK
jgi:WD40 repeat protein